MALEVLGKLQMGVSVAMGRHGPCGGGGAGEASLGSDSLGQEASKEEAHQIHRGPFFLLWSTKAPGRPLLTRGIKIRLPVQKKEV